jgi:hypothetical protein
MWISPAHKNFENLSKIIALIHTDLYTATLIVLGAILICAISMFEAPMERRGNAGHTNCRLIKTEPLREAQR